MTDDPKLWRDMSPEEKGALLLAHHEGKVIEFCRPRGTPDCPAHSWRAQRPIWTGGLAYRVRPERETVKLYGSEGGAWSYERVYFDTLCITYDLVDGEPDCASIRMEKIK